MFRAGSPADLSTTSASAYGHPSAIADSHCSLHGPLIKEETRQHSPIASTILIALLITGFLVNLHLAIKVTYKHENFSRKVISVATNREFLFFEALTVLGLTAVFIASPTLLWTFAAFTFALLFTLIGTQSSHRAATVVNYANLTAVGALATQLGAAYRTVYLVEVIDHHSHVRQPMAGCNQPSMPLLSMVTSFFRRSGGNVAQV